MKRNRTIQVMTACLFLIQMLFLGNAQCIAAENEENQEVKTISDKSSDKIEAQELDLGDYQQIMAVGEKQLLTVTVLPLNTTEQTISYVSSNESVATINGMGRITALQTGTATIKAVCGKVSEHFELTVNEKSEGNAEQTIPVSDIGIADHEDELAVGETLSLSANILPIDATETAVSYVSDNSGIAAVSSTGEVKGVSPGNVSISISAGEITKTVPLKVKIITSAVNLSKNYVVLKRGESWQIKASAEPAGASQAISYKSADQSIAAVSECGLITGKTLGSTTVIVSNEDMSNAVTVIVNEEENQQASAVANADIVTETKENAIFTQTENDLICLLQKQKDIEVSVSDYPVLTKHILKALYEQEAALCIKAPNYTININGKDIVNYENQLYTVIDLKNTKKGSSFTLNEGKNLPGKVTLKFTDHHKWKYLYLYNSEKKGYEKLAAKDPASLQLDTGGRYLLTDGEISPLSVKLRYLVIGGGILLAVVISYILVKRRYWFW